MTFVIEQTIEVTATPAVVQEVIVDLPRYGVWNPFVVEGRSTLAVGDPIDMRVHVFAAAHMPWDNFAGGRGLDHNPGAGPSPQRGGKALRLGPHAPLGAR